MRSLNRASGPRRSMKPVTDPKEPRRSWHPGVRQGARPGVHRWAAVVLWRRWWGSWRWLGHAAVLAMVLAMVEPGLALAESDEISPQQMQSGSLLLRMRSGYAVATRMNTEVDMQVSGLVARVAVRQEFLNDGQEWVEGVYVFPLPDSAAIDRLRMHIGERFIEGEIREKEAAKKAYEQAKADGKKASLVQQQRANLFTTHVANIAPGETVVIEIEYLETLKYGDGNFSIRFPLTLTPRYIPGAPMPDRKGSGWSPDTHRVTDASLITPPVVVRSRDHRVSVHADIDAGVPLEYIASRYHAIEVGAIDVGEQGGRYAVDLKGGDVPMDHDLELTWRPVPDAAPRALTFTETVDGQPHVLLMMLPPDLDLASATRLPRELIFVIDTSGSMHGTSIEQARRALSLALDGLGPTDLFNVIQFNSTTSVLFPGSVEATSSNIGIAKRYVGGLEANGGTEMRPALIQALHSPAVETHLRQIIFITDGSVGNEEELFSLIGTSLGNARLFTVGIGSAPNGWFMRKAAEAGRGTYTYVSALHEVSEKMDRLFRKLEQPQVTGIRVRWPDAAAATMYPEVVPDLYAGEPIVVRARLAQAPRPGDLIAISGTTAGGGWGAELPAAAGSASPGVAALWARARIEDLLDRERRGAAADETRKAIVETALAHHLVSRFTSLVAIDKTPDKTPVRPRSAKLTKEQVPNLLPYGQDHNAIFGFPATATDAPMRRVAGFAMLATALLLLLGQGRRRWVRHAPARV